MTVSSYRAGYLEVSGGGWDDSGVCGEETGGGGYSADAGDCYGI